MRASAASSSARATLPSTRPMRGPSGCDGGSPMASMSSRPTKARAGSSAARRNFGSSWISTASATGISGLSPAARARRHAIPRPASSSAAISAAPPRKPWCSTMTARCCLAAMPCRKAIRSRTPRNSCGKSAALEAYAERAFSAKAMPTLAMGCGVFLQSDIVNQQRKGWSADEIMASLAAVLPVNVWVYAGQLQNLRAIGRKFVLQGGTHRNLAVVKAQVDFIRGKVPDAEIVVHPHPGEAGAIGAALCAGDWLKPGATTRFRGYDAIESLEYTSTTNEHTT